MNLSKGIISVHEGFDISLSLSKDFFNDSQDRHTDKKIRKKDRS